MGLLNPVVSKFYIPTGTIQEVYSCPAGKTHAIVDLNLFKDSVVADSVVAVAISTVANPASLTSIDYIMDNIKLTGSLNFSELSKIVIGVDERLYVKVVSGVDVIVRLTGVEENNLKVIKAGRLVAIAPQANTQTLIFNNNIANTAYTTLSLVICNPSTTITEAAVIWITTAAATSPVDMVAKIQIQPTDTTVLENILLAPNEKIYVLSTMATTEYFINGTIVSV